MKTGKEALNKSALWICALVGLTFVIGSLVADWIFQPESSVSTWIALATDIGMGALLAAVLFVVQRTFLVGLSNSVDKRAEAVAKETAGAIVRENSDLKESVITLQSQLQKDWADRAAATESAIQNIATYPDFFTMVEGLETAQQLGAIHGEVIVAAGKESTSPRFHIVVNRNSVHDQYSEYFNPDSEEPESIIRFGISDPEDDYESVSSIEWEPHLDIISVINELRTIAVREGLTQASKDFNLEIALQNLSKILSQTVNARKGNESWLSGDPLYELIGEGFAVTSGGIEHKVKGTLLSREEILNLYREAYKKRSPLTGTPALIYPESPEGIDSKLWSRAVISVRHHIEQAAHDAAPFFLK